MPVKVAVAKITTISDRLALDPSLFDNNPNLSPEDRAIVDEAKKEAKSVIIPIPEIKREEPVYFELDGTDIDGPSVVVENCKDLGQERSATALKAVTTKKIDHGKLVKEIESAFGCQMSPKDGYTDSAMRTTTTQQGVSIIEVWFRQYDEPASIEHSDAHKTATKIPTPAEFDAIIKAHKG